MGCVDAFLTVSVTFKFNWTIEAARLGRARRAKPTKRCVHFKGAYIKTLHTLYVFVCEESMMRGLRNQGFNIHLGFGRTVKLRSHLLCSMREMDNYFNEPPLNFPNETIIIYVW